MTELCDCGWVGPVSEATKVQKTRTYKFRFSGFKRRVIQYLCPRCGTLLREEKDKT